MNYKVVIAFTDVSTMAAFFLSNTKDLNRVATLANHVSVSLP
jgi:hypothetical protein